MQITTGRQTAQHDGALVVLNIGMRINRYWRPDKWMFPILAMQRMIKELSASPELGLLAAYPYKSGARTLAFVQYWRDFDSLERYASDPAHEHWQNWKKAAQMMAQDDSVGFFHETFCVEPGGMENIYINMPQFGVGAIKGTTPATGYRLSARGRMTGREQ